MSSKGFVAEEPPPLADRYKDAFLKGLATLLPTALTIGVLVWCYGFVHDTIAAPINDLARGQLAATEAGRELGVALLAIDDEAIEEGAWRRARAEVAEPDEALRAELVRRRAQELRAEAIRGEIEDRFPEWLGFLFALGLVLVVGFTVANWFGRKALAAAEALILSLPVVKAIYPQAKQLVQFVFAPKRGATVEASAVVAVEWPRRGMWSLGFLTGPGIREVAEKTGDRYRSVFLPSSPTPFTGYVCLVKESEIVRLEGVTVDDVLKYVVSGGVLSPSKDLVVDAKPASARLEPPAGAPEENG